MAWVGGRVRDIDMNADVAIFMNTREGKETGLRHGIELEQGILTYGWRGGHVATVVKSSIVIRKATLFNVMYACMHIRICVSLCTNAAMVLRHVSSHVAHEATDVRIM